MRCLVAYPPALTAAGITEETGDKDCLTTVDFRPWLISTGYLNRLAGCGYHKSFATNCPTRPG